MAKKDYQKLTNIFNPILSDKTKGIEIQITGFKTSGTKTSITMMVDPWHIEQIVESYAKILDNRRKTNFNLLERLKQKSIPQ